MNKLIIIGNATRDAQEYQIKAGGSITKFCVAVNRKGTDGGVDYFNVTAFRELAKSCLNYVKKGMQVAVVGSVKLNSYEQMDGEIKSSLDVIAQEVKFLSFTQNEGGTRGLTPVDDDDELPF